MKKHLLSLFSAAITLTACQAQSPVVAPQNALPSLNQPVAQASPQAPASQTNPQTYPSAQPVKASPAPAKTPTPVKTQATPKPVSSASTAPSSTPSPSPIASPATPRTDAPAEVQISQNYHIEQIVAGLHMHLGKAEAEAIAKKHNLLIDRFIDSIKTVVYRTQGQNVTEMIQLLSQEPALEYVETDQVALQKPEKEKAVTESFRVASNLTTSDSYFDKQYGMHSMQIPESWALATGKNKVVAVIDTGVSINHPDLKGQMVDGYDAYSRQAGPTAGDVSSLNYVMDSYKHGTHVAGIIAALTNNGKGIAGVAPDAKIMPIKIFPDLSDMIKSFFSPPDEDANATIISILADGIVWAADNGADVINMSLAVREQSSTLERAVKYALQKNISVVVAAGNDRHIDNARNYLAAIEGVIGVGATDEADKVTFFSNSGDYVSVAAAGYEVISTVPSFLGLNQYVHMSGTSMAAPQVAGVAALLQDKYGAQATPAWIKSRLEQTASDKGDPGWDNLYGHGVINAYKALGGE